MLCSIKYSFHNAKYIKITYNAYTFVAGKFRKEFKRTFRCSHNSKTCVHKRGNVTGISDPLKQRSRTYTRSVHTLSNNNNNNVQQNTEAIPLSAIINVPQSQKQE